MVIQENMSAKAIVEVWGHTVDVFTKYDIPLNEEPLESCVDVDILDSLLRELNAAVGSSTVTCIEGG